jgi:integrase
VRLGNWLTPEQGRRLLDRATPASPRELRDHAMIAMLIGCGLRRAELLALSLESIQQREEHWVIADLVGKGGHVRTVPIPTWVKSEVDAWTAAAITQGHVFRAINKAGRIWGDGMSPQGALGCRPRGGGSHWDRQAGPARSAAHLRPSVPPRGRRTGSDPVSARSRLHSDHGALLRMQAEAPDCGERPIGNRA